MIFACLISVRYRQRIIIYAIPKKAAAVKPTQQRVNAVNSTATTTDAKCYNIDIGKLTPLSNYAQAGNTADVMKVSVDLQKSLYPSNA